MVVASGTGKGNGELFAGYRVSIVPHGKLLRLVHNNVNVLKIIELYS